MSLITFLMVSLCLLINLILTLAIILKLSTAQKSGVKQPQTVGKSKSRARAEVKLTIMTMFLSVLMLLYMIFFVLLILNTMGIYFPNLWFYVGDIFALGNAPMLLLSSTPVKRLLFPTKGSTVIVTMTGKSMKETGDWIN